MNSCTGFAAKLHRKNSSADLLAILGFWALALGFVEHLAFTESPVSMIFVGIRKDFFTFIQLVSLSLFPELSSSSLVFSNLIFRSF
jgi:hypothetical protein